MSIFQQSPCYSNPIAFLLFVSAVCLRSVWFFFFFFFCFLLHVEHDATWSQVVKMRRTRRFFSIGAGNQYFSFVVNSQTLRQLSWSCVIVHVNADAAPPAQPSKGRGRGGGDWSSKRALPEQIQLCHWQLVQTPRVPTSLSFIPPCYLMAAHIQLEGAPPPLLVGMMSIGIGFCDLD